MKAIKFSEQISINRPAADVFDYTQDYSKRLKWDEFLKQADLKEGASQAGKGVKAYCVAKNGLGMVTEYITYQRPKVTAIKMTKGPYLFKSFQGSWTFRETGDRCTSVIFLYTFQLRFPFTVASGYITKNLQKNVRLRLQCLKENMEQAAGK